MLNRFRRILPGAAVAVCLGFVISTPSIADSGGGPEVRARISKLSEFRALVRRPEARLDRKWMPVDGDKDGICKLFGYDRMDPEVGAHEMPVIDYAYIEVNYFGEIVGRKGCTGYIEIPPYYRRAPTYDCRQTTELTCIKGDPGKSESRERDRVRDKVEMKIIEDNALGLIKIINPRIQALEEDLPVVNDLGNSRTPAREDLLCRYFKGSRAKFGATIYRAPNVWDTSAVMMGGVASKMDIIPRKRFDYNHKIVQQIICDK